MKQEIIAISNHKGGVAKTETAVNLSVAIQRGTDKKVLLIDADAQFNATSHLGIYPSRLSKEGIPTLAEDLRKVMKCRKDDVPYEYDGKSTVHTDEGIDLIPGSYELTDVEEEMVLEKDPESIFSEYLSSFKDQYDYILIDEHPSLGVLNRSIQRASTQINIPMIPEQFSAQGLVQMIKRIRIVDPKIPINAEFCIVDPNISDTKKWFKEITGRYKKIIRFYKTYINKSASFGKAKDKGQSIFEYEPTSIGARKYFALAREILGKDITSFTKKVNVDLKDIDLDPSIAKWRSASDELIEDIKNNGVKERLAVREKQNGRLELVHGYRRFDAANKLDFDKVPCEVIKITLNQIPIYRHKANNKEEK